MVDQAKLSVGDARKLLAPARLFVKQIEQLRSGESALRAKVQRAFPTLREHLARRELSKLPLSRLREVTRGRLILEPLERAGITSVLQVYELPEPRLEQIQGIGPKTAHHLMAAARQLAVAVQEDLRIRIDLDPSDRTSSTVIEPLHHLLELNNSLRAVRQTADQLTSELQPELQAAAATASYWRKSFARTQRRSEARTATERVSQLLASAESTELVTRVANAHRILLSRPSHGEAWDAFQYRSPEFYALLAEIVHLGGDGEAASGYLPAELIEQVSAHPLDDTLLGISLRGYQAFGARFALAQRRVLIGDEMGLGKTIQAIAVMTHLRSTGATHFLVSCPASVLVNWTREIRARSLLTPYALHGPGRANTQHSWERHGGVAITTFDILHTLTVSPEVTVAQFVVDEAHYVKNYRARRSQAVEDWAVRVPRVLFLSGTPLENRVDEFQSLVRYLQPRIAGTLGRRDSIVGASTFRKTVAPVYLRRNQVDVLMELPELIRVDEWIEFGRQDREAYRSAVVEGNFMAMRRAAFAPRTPQGSAKLERLLQIVEESIENEFKVVIFTYFTEVLYIIRDAVKAKFEEGLRPTTKVFDPISGAVPPADRQRIIDEFSSRQGHSVLLAQVQAGGTGLNIQAASVVIICEPQVKPSLEEQAIARLHRMGQVRSVQSHRLLAAHSVDQRMIEILAHKTKLFDEYARRSDTADGAPEAVDISEAELARKIIAEEQRRLSPESAGEPESPGNDSGSQET